MEECYVCNNCGVEQPKENFSALKSGEIKRKCRSCNNGQKRILTKLRRQHSYPYSGGDIPLPNWFRSSIHSYTDSPDYKCPICEKTLQELFAKKQTRLKVWVLDHCHKTNTFKGWLCHNCNTKIGNENKQFFKNAISYLEKHEERINESNT